MALFFNPLLASIPPYATGPALILVGAMMVTNIITIRWDNVQVCAAQRGREGGQQSTAQRMPCPGAIKPAARLQEHGYAKRSKLLRRVLPRVWGAAGRSAAAIATTITQPALTLHPFLSRCRLQEGVPAFITMAVSAGSRFVFLLRSCMHVQMGGGGGSAL